jgi:hypothetical protein
LSEFASYEPVGVTQAEPLSDGFGAAASETAATEPEAKSFPRLDGEVGPLVAANADVVAPCWWMGGAEVTLTAAMCNYYTQMMEENADQILADVRDFIANQVTKTEEVEEQGEAEEEEPEKPKDDNQKIDESNDAQKEPADPKIKNTEIQTKKEAVTAKVPQSAARADNPAKPVINTKAATQVHATPEPTVGQSSQQAKSESAAEAMSAAEPPRVETALAVEAVRTAEPPRAEAAAVIDSVLGPGPEPEPSLAPAPHTHEAGAVSASEPGLMPEISQPAPDQPSSLQADAGIESTVDYGVNDLVSADTESPIIIEEGSNLPAEIIEACDSELPIQMAFDQIMAEGFVEEVSLTQMDGAELEAYDLHEPADLPVVPAGEAQNIRMDEEVLFFEPGIEPGPPETTEPNLYEEPIRVDSTVESIEATLVELTEVLEVSEPETAAAVKLILDKIIEVPRLLEAAGEAVITEEEAQAELEELFVELFVQIGMDYTPELIESLARLTLTWQLTAEIGSLKIEDEPDKTPQDSGTHEIIKKLLACLKYIKKALAHAAAIGKSALRLCSFSLGAAEAGKVVDDGVAEFLAPDFALFHAVLAL